MNGSSHNNPLISIQAASENEMTRRNIGSEMWRISSLHAFKADRCLFSMFILALTDLHEDAAVLNYWDVVLRTSF